MAKKQEYGNESITSLKGADRVRKRPAVIFGSDGVEGCAHSIFEIVSNSIDEARDGHGDTINVTRCKDGSVIVEDFGRGMPVDWNKGEERYNWELLFCEMYAGGKYGEGEDNYEFSLGLNGLGLCATQYASAWMTADIYRDGFHYHLDFQKGENVGGLHKEPFKGRRTGSIIHWKPDDEVFTDIDVPGSYYKDVLRRQAVVNAGLTLNFTDEKEKDPATGKPWKESWCYEHGIADYVAETAGEDSLTPVFSCESEATGRDRDDQPEYKVKMSAAFCFSNKVQMLEYYHNSSWLEHGGSPEHAVRTAFVYQINKYLKDKNLYKKGESAISFQDVQDCLVYVSSSFSTRTSYENQTKKAITNKFVSQAMTDFLKHYLEVYFLEKPDEAQKICQQVLVNKQSREHAEKTRQSIKKTLTTQIDLANRVQKFVDCRTKDASRRELYIVEGDSAMGAVKTSRDSEYQAIMPIRGKILNCLKADYARIFKSDVIVDLIKVMGCGVELGGKHNKELATFNLDNLRFNKIVICTDADVDGYQIRTLVLTMLYRLTPTLINEGYVYIAESPLYEITTKDRTYFAYTEPEKATFLEEIGDKKYTIQRSKGLGENDPEMMWLTTMNPESRRLIKVMPTDVERTAQVFDILLGDNLAGRKEHIAQHGDVTLGIQHPERPDCRAHGIRARIIAILQDRHAICLPDALAHPCRLIFAQRLGGSLRGNAEDQPRCKGRERIIDKMHPHYGHLDADAAIAIVDREGERAVSLRNFPRADAAARFFYSIIEYRPPFNLRAREQRVVPIQNQRRVFIHPVEQLQLRLADIFARTQLLHMGNAYVRDDSHRWCGGARHAGNLPEAAHPHFKHCRAIA